MDISTIDNIAEFICGDDATSSPVYRTGADLTKFFYRAGITRFVHDGSSRKKWTSQTLQSCTLTELELIIKRIASPKEYGGDADKTHLALKGLNRMLAIEGQKVELDGVEPHIIEAKIDFNIRNVVESKELKPLPPPDFTRLGIEVGIDEVLKLRWEEADKCVKVEAYLASIIVMGSLLEGLLLAVIQRFPKDANLSKSAPKDRDGKIKQYHQWTLSEMIDVAHEEKWIDLDVKLFSHSLRMFRNLIHPYEQVARGVFPDKDTSDICWLVVQAAVNDLARVLIGK